MNNDVSFVVHRARDLGRVGSRPSQISLHWRGASGWATGGRTSRAGLLVAPILIE